jgi:uncharacterized protein (DUF433 family)
MHLVEATNPNPLREDSQGFVRVGQTRVTLQSVVELFEQGASAEEIALRFESVSLAEVYAVLSFYTAHRQDVAAYLSGQGKESDMARATAASRSPLHELRRRLLERKSA